MTEFVTSTTTVPNDNTMCGSRLPCGLCRLTMSYCPLAPINITTTPTWVTTTASGTKADEVEE